MGRQAFAGLHITLSLLACGSLGAARAQSPAADPVGELRRILGSPIEDLAARDGELKKYS